MNALVNEARSQFVKTYEGNLKDFPTDLQGRAQRGGSFLCNSNYCHGYRLSARSATSPESSLFHVGFRCVKNIKW